MTAEQIRKAIQDSGLILPSGGVPAAADGGGGDPEGWCDSADCRFLEAACSNSSNATPSGCDGSCINPCQSS